jgi:hypothetical protein
VKFSENIARNCGYQTFLVLKKITQQHNGRCVSAHQLRDCQYAIDAGDKIFAPAMKRLLLRAFVIHRRRDRMDEARLERYRSNLRERLITILSLMPGVADLG